MVDMQPETALVLGGTGGIGSEIVSQLLQQGLRVVATYRTQKKDDDLNLTYLQVDFNQIVLNEICLRFVKDSCLFHLNNN